MANGDLKILSSCKKLIGEIQGYCWDPKASEKGYDAPIKRADHAIDCTRYGIFTHFGQKISLKEPAQNTNFRTLGYGMLRERMGNQYPGPKIVQDINTWDTRDPFRGNPPRFSGGNF